MLQGAGMCMVGWGGRGEPNQQMVQHICKEDQPYRINRAQGGKPGRGVVGGENTGAKSALSNGKKIGKKGNGVSKNRNANKSEKGAITRARGNRKERTED